MTEVVNSRYHLIEVIGQGAMGVVWRAHDAVLDREVALKELRPSVGVDLPEAVDRFLVEARAAARLSHPNIVAIHDVFTDGDAVMIVMELIEGSTFEVFADDPNASFPVRTAMTQVAMALAAAHAAGVIHRDLKPANVIWTADERAVVTDFGLARIGAGRGTIEGTIMGTPGYMSPEQLRGTGTGAATDIFAWGAMAYHLATGKAPFGDPNVTDPVAMAYRIVHEDPEPLQLPGDRAFAAVITAAMAKESLLRPTDGHELVVMLARETGDAPTLGLAPASSARNPASGSASTDVEVSTATLSETPPLIEDGPISPVADRVPQYQGADRETKGSSKPLAWVRTRRLPAAMVALVMGVAAVGFGLNRGTGQAAAQPVSFAFAPTARANGLIVARQWSLGGDKGDRLQQRLRLTNSSSVPVSDEFDEVIPTSIARSAGDVVFSPSPDRIVAQADPVVVRYAVADLAPSSYRELAYEVTVPAGEATVVRLAAWAAEHASIQAGLSGAADQDIALTALVVVPASVSLLDGQDYQLSPTGTMSDATAAPPSILSGVVWSSSDPAVVGVADGRVKALGTGSATITAQAGDLTATVAVTVATSTQLAAGPQVKLPPPSYTPPVVQASGPPPTLAPLASSTTTAVPPTSPPSSTPAAPPPSATAPPATSPPVTAPPATSPPTTSPPTTSPPTTSPPTTSPPTTSPPTTSPPHTSYTVDVKSEAGWQDSGVQLKSGDRYTIAYVSGSWTVDHRNLTYVGPQGYSADADAAIYQGCKWQPSVRYGALIMMIGSGTWDVVSRGGSFVASRDGRLFLRIHDADQCLVDNAGSVRMNVTKVGS